MEESVFDEMKACVRFGPEDERGLRLLAPHAAPHFPRIAEESCVKTEPPQSEFRDRDRFNLEETHRDD